MKRKEYIKPAVNYTEMLQPMAVVCGSGLFDETDKTIIGQ